MGKNADAHALSEKNSKIDTRWAYEGTYLKVRHDTIHTPHHPEKNWDIVVMRGAVAVIPIDSQGRIVLVEQWRRAIEKVTLELPAGMLDPGESPEECAQRELQKRPALKPALSSLLEAVLPLLARSVNISISISAKTYLKAL